MTDRITRLELSRMIAAAASRIREQHARLSQLDCVAGDGDHGSAMLRTMDRLEAAFAKDSDLKSCFCEAGWSVMGADGGASTSLLGAFFLGVGESASPDKDSWTCADLANAFRAGLSAVEAQTKARPGDKTMMDALTPAVEALGRTSGCSDFEQALAEAARAATTGAESTRDMIAKYGRARHLGEKTRGSEDAGAASIAIIFDGFSRALNSHHGDSNA